MTPEATGARGDRTFALIPAWNEEPRLPRVLKALRELDPRLEVLVVDDGSRDRTSEVAREGGATVLRHPFNMGYGAALQTGYKFALSEGARRLVQLDADGQHDPAQIPALLQPLLDDEADVVIGSRFVEETAYKMDPLKSLGRKVFHGAAKFVGLELTDPTSGFQALDRKALELYVRDFFPWDYPDVDVLMVAHKSGIRIVERSVVMSQGERASTMHGGLKSFYYVYRMLLSLWAGTRLESR